MVDPELAAWLRDANLGALFFAFIAQGGYGKLIISKFAVSPARITEVKKALGGGGAAVTGQCLGPLTNMVFQVDKKPPPALALAIQQAVKRDTGMLVVVRVQLAAGAEGSPWPAARQRAINDLKALATKVVATKDPEANRALPEILAIITGLPANPALDEIARLKAFIRNEETIAAAEEGGRRFQPVKIREPLLNALEALKQ